MTRSQRSKPTEPMPPDLEEHPFSEDRNFGTYTPENAGRPGSTGNLDPAGPPSGSSPMDLSGRAAAAPRGSTGPITSAGEPPYPEESRQTRHGTSPARLPATAAGSATRSISRTSALTDSSSGASTASSTGTALPANEPIITPVGQMPESVRASARSPAGTTAVTVPMGPPTTAPPPAPSSAPPSAATPRTGRPSAGELVSAVAADMSTLFRKEVALAKAEVRQSASRAGKSAGMSVGAAGAAVFAVLFLLLAAMFGLAEVMALGWAALIVAAILALSAAALGLVAKQTVKKVHPAPTQTVETLKEDVRWASGLRK